MTLVSPFNQAMKRGLFSILLILGVGKWMILAADPPADAPPAAIYEFNFDFIMRMDAKWREENPEEAEKGARIHPRFFPVWNGLQLEKGDEIVHRRIGSRDFFYFRGAPESHEMLNRIHQRYMGTRMNTVSLKLLEVLEAAEEVKQRMKP